MMFNFEFKFIYSVSPRVRVRLRNGFKCIPAPAAAHPPLSISVRLAHETHIKTRVSIPRS